ncbi:hypothetical protein Acr_11g0006020 [Actinidia rufa]|uniref:J domain-containing protein n=1 Tax=Actinidia rufa TaxID=165716 RepID=A0A7J0FCX6_9ERIC|nr:hypothetical protein Acr_11g0006020 [Actinidia rufa]
MDPMAAGERRRRGGSVRGQESCRERSSIGLYEKNPRCLRHAHHWLEADPPLPRLVRDPAAPLPHVTADLGLIATHYRQLAILLNPPRNRLPFADEAFKLVYDAWSVLNPSEKGV